MVLCGVCDKLDLKHFVSPNARNIVHHVTLEELQKCAKSTSCGLCTMLTSSFDNQVKLKHLNPKSLRSEQVILRPVQFITAGQAPVKPGSAGGIYWIKVRASEANFLYNLYPDTESKGAVPIPQSMIMGRKVHPANSPEAFNTLRR